jgi:hypothetical protein
MNATTTTTTIDRRPVPRVGDNLDRLLDLLDRARDEQEVRARQVGPLKPHRVLLETLKHSA